MIQLGMVSPRFEQMWGGQPMDGMMSGWWGFGILWMLFWIALLVLVVVLIWRLLEARSGTPGRPEESPLDILKRRYATGEIEFEEFELRKRELGYS